MNVVKCKNGHFFDGDGYAVCPHCGEAIATGSVAPMYTEKKEKKGLFGKKKEVTTQQQYSQPMYGSQQQYIPQNQSEEQLVISIAPTNTLSPGGVTMQKEDKTLDFWASTNNVINAEIKDDEIDYVYKDEIALEINNSLEDTQEIVEKNESVKPVEETNSLKEAIQKASANTEGKTMGYFSKMSSSSAMGKDTPVMNDPVVGWLVCVAGSHFGESFGISAGKNSIGRGADNSIVLSRDGSVSKSKHAIVVYEPKKRNFYIQPGDSSGLTYLNDDYITETKMISSHDMLEFGDSKFIFIPLCGENFTWEDYMQKE